ncbi:hypothetical protein [Spongiibacter sp.]|uniref:hypothetical protein n=1 Tax=Spongiibacter sp. TaxID=2024860 RepID=UPI000C572587|nr:hypothetical protein [Spongiibacter sp.]MBU71891.1 hypothetical protein [Spongiibacter sp.]HCP22334.1 hypothetical protein [Marinobacter nauticus]|tara:strand:+ start:335 stop:571 length:237 start_codon:yes stop_codon:yes gene_type:complete
MTDYKCRVMQVVVHPEKDAFIFSEMATRISIDDEGGGEFVKAEQTNTGSILINPDEWPELRAAIDRMVAECERAGGEQ